MPVATPEQYAEMLDKAKAGGYAFPAINAASSQSINAVLQGLTEAGSDGIIQVTTGGADYFAGHTVKARATGAIAFAKFATEVAKNYPVTVALHTDHCPKDKLDSFVRPLLAISEERVARGELRADKLFHVSPFNVVEGGYRFRFQRQRQVQLCRIDYEDAEGAVLLTSISGQPQAWSAAAVLKAFLRMPLLTLGVFARIHWQAFKLWRKGVPFHGAHPLPRTLEESSK